MKTDTIKTCSIIAGLIVMIVTAVLAVDKYFAKSVTVDTLSDRVDISISDDRVFQQQQTVRQLDNLVRFERRKIKPTEIERKIIKQEQQRLEDLKEARNDKVKRYESRKK